MRVLVAIVSAMLLLGACGKSKGNPADRPPDTCASDRDCPQGWRCLARKCADPSAAAYFTDPEHAVTPGKVRDQVEQVNQEHEQAVDDKMKKAEQE